VPQVRAVVRDIDPDQPVAMIRTTGEWVSRSLDGRRIPTVLLGLFSALTVVLAGLGVYGVLAFSVTQRAREFGIRRALGANVPSILSLVLSQVFKTAGSGIVIGMAAALALSRYLESQLFNVSARDPEVFVGVAAVLLGVALASTFVPARRALRIDPARVLRDA
jgi:ABC-type antimicrobial peptide transport system permease subunit